MKPENVRVLCFPGAEVEGQEALEVKEVYLPLGILPENVVGLEEDSTRAERLRATKLGIEIVDQNDLDYFRGNSDTFHVISLDYTGQQTRERLEVPALIAGRHLLGKNGIFCTNYSGKRESRPFQTELMARRILFSPAYREEVDDPTDRSAGFSGYINLAKELEQEYRDMGIGNERLVEDIASGELRDLGWLREGITHTTLAYLTIGSLALAYHTETPERYMPQFLMQHPVAGIVRERLRQSYVQQSGDPTFKDRHRIFLKALGVARWQDLIDKPENSGENFSTAMVEEYGDYLERTKGIPRHIGTMFSLMRAEEEKRPYVIADMERYQYTSNKNFFMLMDMFAVRQPYKIYQLLDSVVEDLRNNVPFARVRNGSLSYTRNWSRLCAEYAEDRGLNHHDVPERHDLGSSWVPRDRISRTDAIDFLKANCSPAEIAECFSGFSRRQLAAMKAHVTMGTYD
ncbi:MAG: hypothetical protein OXR66_05155 [Candidatus Woesearchaeota archaeon]|nr:hypothetical protein [Candidatus Woesearchaeota archaeon]